MAYYLSVISFFFIPNLFIVAGNNGADKYRPQHRDNLHCFKNNLQRRFYFLYDVNWGEGFNLRRDVYVRMAVFAKKMQDASRDCDGGDSPRPFWILVLPPWGPLYHWQSRELTDQFGLPWSKFFDLESLRSFVIAMEFEDYLKEKFGVESENRFVDRIVYLQHVPFDGNWEDRLSEEECKENDKYELDENGRWRGFFWGYQNDFYARNLTCLSVMGHASIMKDYLTSFGEGEDGDGSALLLDRAETLLHDVYGDKDYWSARRSMVFASHLRAVGDRFRAEVLGSDDENDATVMDPDWKKNEKVAGEAKGGPYLAIHLRRKDYIKARPGEVPSLKSAASQSKKILKKLNLTRVFVASDAPDHEIHEFQDFLTRNKKKKTPATTTTSAKEWKEETLPYTVHRFKPSMEELKEFGDGGVAIIDQWIAAHARFFIGSHESTFSFRIQEERQILGFHPDTIFNRFCGSNKECERPSKWLIVY